MIADLDDPRKIVDRLPTAPKLLQDFHTLLEESRELARHSTPQSLEQANALKRLAQCVEETGEVMRALHNVTENDEDQKGEGYLRFLRGTHQSLRVLKGALERVKEAFDEGDDSPGPGPSAA